MFFSNHVVCIIASYLKPKLLSSFFVRYSLDFALKFKYDAYKYDAIRVRHLICAIRYFPNIILVGVNLKFLAQQLLDSFESFKDVKRVGLTGEGIQLEAFDKYKITHLNLRCYDAHFIFDLKPFANSLQHFEIFGDGHVDVRGISKCDRLVTFVANNAVYSYVVELDELAKCENVRKLGVDKCADWNKVVDLVNLRELVVWSDVAQKNLVGLERCRKLRNVNIHGRNLHDVRALSECKRLKKANLYSSVKIEGVGNLVGLRELRIRGHDQDIEIRRCEGLKKLDVVCKSANLNFLIGLRKLRKIILYDCDNLVDLNGLGENVKALSLYGCKNLVDLSGLGENVERLILSGCEELVDVDYLGRLKKLGDLHLEGCGVERIEWEMMRDVRSVKLVRCGRLGCVGGLSCVEGLQVLKLWECREVETLPSLAGCALRKIDIQLCRNLRDIDGLKGCVNLKSVKIRNCDKLVGISDWEGMGLEDFSLDDCEMVSVCGGCVTLKEFRLYGCRGIRSIDGLCGCVNLEYVELWNLKALWQVPDLGESMLEKIDIRYCGNLRDVGGLSKCRYLEEIMLVSCVRIEDLSCLANCVSLKTVEMWGRPRQLVENPGFCISDTCVIEVYDAYVGGDWRSL